MKVNYTEEAIADIVEAISYLNRRNPKPLRILMPRSLSASSVWRRKNLKAQSRGCDPALSCEVGQCRRSASTTSGILPNC